MSAKMNPWFYDDENMFNVDDDVFTVPVPANQTPFLRVLVFIMFAFLSKLGLGLGFGQY
jgi:hypothetical protein